MATCGGSFAKALFVLSALWFTPLASGLVAPVVSPPPAGPGVPANIVQTPKSELQSLFLGTTDPVLASPKTKAPLRIKPRFRGGVARVAYVSSEDENETYGAPLGGAYLDLVSETTTVSRTPSVLFADLADTLRRQTQRSASELVQVETFRSPVTAFLYERGWRDSFKRNGFPGIDDEFEELSEFAKETLFVSGDNSAASVVVDLSCGTGLMTRKLVAATKNLNNVRVVAADYSEAMLLESRRRLQDAFGGDDAKVLLPDLVRVDVAALPFVDASVDLVHAGAALHCWPDAEAGLAEIRRSLKPGGKFFATTFLKGAMGTPGGSSSPDATTSPSRALSFSRLFSRPTVQTGFRFFTLDELETLATNAGFVDVDVRREGSFCAVLKCAVPRGDDDDGDDDSAAVATLSNDDDAAQQEDDDSPSPIQ